MVEKRAEQHRNIQRVLVDLQRVSYLKGELWAHSNEGWEQDKDHGLSKPCLLDILELLVKKINICN